MKKTYLLLGALSLFAISSACLCMADETASEAELTIDLEDAAEEETEEEMSLEEVITGYLISDAEKYVTLADYEGQEITKYIYQVTDDDVESEISNLMYDYAYQEDVDRPIEDGDTVYMDITLTVDGEEEDLADYYIDLGYEELGPDVDEQLIGCRTGDTLTVTSDFDEDSEFEDWAGKTVQFDITVNSVTETAVPELTDEFAKENLSFDTADEYRESVRERLQTSYDQQSEAGAVDSAISSAVSESSFAGYPKELLGDALSDVRKSYQSFADMFGMELEEILESFGVAEDDLEAEAEDIVNRRLFVSALCLKEDLSVTGEDVQQYLEDNYVMYGYESADAFMNDYDYGSIVQSTYEAKAGQFLLDHGTVTETEYDLSSVDAVSEDGEGDIVLDDYDEEDMSEEYWDELDWELDSEDFDWEDESGLIEEMDEE